MFGQGIKSYKDLPLYLAEFGKVCRYEAAGGLAGLMRVREFTQDDAHIFCTEEQLETEVVKILRFIKDIYGKFGFDKITMKLATRPLSEFRIGTDEVWDKAEGALKHALDANGIEYEIAEHDAAFYGPKIDNYLKDSMGRVCRAFILEKGRVLKKRARFEDAEELIRADADADFIRLERLGLPKPGVPQTVEFSKLPSFSPEPDISRTPFVPEDPERRRERCREVFEIQVGGLKRRAEQLKTGRLIVGVSGGLDSTLALLVSAAANDRNKQPRKGVLGVTMPCFGTTKRTKGNAEKLMEKLGVSSKEISIKKAVEQHFRDIGQKSGVFDSAFENAQARERTQVLMDVANQTNGLVVGTGDLSEAALGWATFGGDHLSMYNVNCGVPKTLVRAVVEWYADNSSAGLRKVLLDILATPVSPELLPSDGRDIAQKTEELIGPYELHDFFLFHTVRRGAPPEKLLFLARRVFKGRYADALIVKCLKLFISRFLGQQFKRSCSPDGVGTGSVSLSPRAGMRIPSDAFSSSWLEEL